MKDNKNKPKTIGNLAPSVSDGQQFVCTGNISNITGHFNLHDLGVMKQMEKKIEREKFFNQYLSDISSIFNLNNGQRELLKELLSNKRYAGVFKYNDDEVYRLAKATGMTPITIRTYFGSLCATQKLIKRYRWKAHYQLNTDFLFHPQEANKADFLTVSLTYRFTDDSPVVSEKPHKVTLKMIDDLLALYRQQQEVAAKVERFVNPEKSEDAPVEEG